MVNNAAVQIEQELAETTEEQLDRILAVNLKGVFFGCKHAVRVMRPAGGVDRQHRLHPGPGRRRHPGRVLRRQGWRARHHPRHGGAVRRDGIRCNAICPGDIDTPLVQAYFDTPTIRPRCARRSAPSIRWNESPHRARSHARPCSWPATTPRS
jgi:NAD(P)-dependent dehydrogenase (short-subunit alcohol dehydrogenase family)